MAATYELIASNTLGSSASSVTFNSIPDTYTDLILKMSLRSDINSTRNYVTFRFNSDSGTIYSTRILYSNGASISNDSVSNRADLFSEFLANGATSTSNTFSNVEMYIASYTVSNDKPICIDGATENNDSVNAMLTAVAGLFRSATAISSITIYSGATSSPTDNFVSGSSFFLYGIKNS